MIIDPTPVVLFTAIGSHHTAIKYFLQNIAVKTIYAIVPEQNTPEFTQKQREIRSIIEIDQRNLNHKITVDFVTVNHLNIIETFAKLIRLYAQHTDQCVITDISGGHKITSHTLVYVHTFAQLFLHLPSQVVYFPFSEQSCQQSPMVIPTLPVRVLSRQKVRLLSLLAQTSTGGKSIAGAFAVIPRSVVYRYAKELQQDGFYDGRQLTMLGQMYNITHSMGVTRAGK